MKKKKLKFLMATTALVLVFSTVGLTACKQKSTGIINIAGSSTVYPFMSALSDVYVDVDDTVDLITTPSGSGSGIKEARDLKKDLGIASRFATNEEVNEQWLANDIKTFTFAWDGIAILYYVPGLEELNIDEQGLSQLYKAFAGYEQLKLSDLDKNIAKEYADINIAPFARSGGAAASGTAEAFLYNTQLVDTKTLEDNVIQALEFGNYGKHVKVTSEANSQAFQRIDSDQIVGSMIYLSAGFVKNNFEYLYKKGFRVASIAYNHKYVKPFDYNVSDQQISITDINVAKGYQWYRPLNILFSVSKSSQKTKDFLYWLLINEKAQTVIEKTGGINLTDEQKLVMFVGENKNIKWLKDPTKKRNFFVSDEKTFKIKNNEIIDFMDFYQKEKVSK
ncbi:substrate-binding domain-containing protein [Ureaplasma miroungigenitalium]|uniref:PstS family phosphate ABC transporter substrate-binding protein n=1 Tax=Ureaplasma miroungigenitalium TaxID=1042321 RepID=UPI0021E93874|nr:substrate-binding domain-containing protein [Ureaplasma miroungigenitalium]MCV3734304.1 substrate-binding domain-containing protein [Ureaplasma miroungigenitalium]